MKPTRWETQVEYVQRLRQEAIEALKDAQRWLATSGGNFTTANASTDRAARLIREARRQGAR